MDSSLAIRDKMAAELMNELPASFHKALKKRVGTLEAMKKNVKLGDTNVDNMELYARLLVLFQKRDIALCELFNYEFCPMPLSLFDE